MRPQPKTRSVPHGPKSASSVLSQRQMQKTCLKCRHPDWGRFAQSRWKLWQATHVMCLAEQHGPRCVMSRFTQTDHISFSAADPTHVLTQSTGVQLADALGLLMASGLLSVELADCLDRNSVTSLSAPHADERDQRVWRLLDSYFSWLHKGEASRPFLEAPQRASSFLFGAPHAPSASTCCRSGRQMHARQESSC